MVGSLEHSVLPSVRKFRELGVTSTRNIDELSELDIFAREVSTPELTDMADSSDDSVDGEEQKLVSAVETDETEDATIS